MSISERGPIIAEAQEREQLRQLDGFDCERDAQASAPVRLIGPSGREYELPETVVRLLAAVVHTLAAGDAVTVVPVAKDITTQQAADVLNVSRQYLVRVLERGDIPFHKVGSHRRIAVADVLRYKRQRDHARQRGFAQLAELSQELGLYEP
jgi:excisionase family DNA binding protein